MSSEPAASPVPIPPDEIETPRLRLAHVDLFLISFVILFLELACIRWFGSTVIYLTFFTNTVLMASVLGMSVGCLAASGTRSYIESVIPWALIAVALAYGTLEASQRDQIQVYVGNQESPQHVYFGAEGGGLGSIGRSIPIEVVSGLFYGLIALVFLGLGQVLGRSFRTISNPIAAYSTNLLGSLAGIAAFGAVSSLRTSPVVWFAVGLGLTLRFVTRWRPLQVLGVVATLALVGLASAPADVETERVTWSPYYKVRYTPKSGRIETNNIGHQNMVDIGASGVAYFLPHLLTRDAGGGPLEDVLIIGAGSGNDVATALRNGARHVDAVEIDPVLYELGRAGHPDHPYDDSRVTVHLDDGRSAVRKLAPTYDAVIYALVDSLVLHSGYSSLRLESFLFTEQAFRDVKERLKPDGVFVMYNYFRQGWVVGRLAKLAEKVFGTKPIVFSLPYRSKISASKAQTGAITLLMVGKSESALARIRDRFAHEGVFWASVSPRNNEPVNGYGPTPPKGKDTLPGDWRKIAPATVETEGIGRLPTDDWPFLYLREPWIPLLNLRGMLIVVAISLLLLRLFAPVRAVRPNWQMFFLGAGFMLLETKGVVHLALLFGSTWVVNSFVFFAILVMTLLSNLYVAALRPNRVRVAYVLLIAALAINALVPMTVFLALPGSLRVVVSCAVVFVPIFFAGIVFATLFRDSRQPDVDLGSNIGGVILGGLSENLSLSVGFNGLLLVAIGFYLLSAVLAPRLRAPAAV
jgi:SAM-dependent methyltransferase